MADQSRYPQYLLPFRTKGYLLLSELHIFVTDNTKFQVGVFRLSTFNF